MVTSLLQKSSGTDQFAHLAVIIILLLLIILAMVAWNWVSSLPPLFRSLFGWAALILGFMLATELLPWQRYALLGRQLGLEALGWMDARPLVILLILPALMVGSMFWETPGGNRREK